MKKIFLTVPFLFLYSSTTIAASDAYVNTRILSTALAIQVATVAEQTCKQKGYQVTVAVTDRYGQLLSLVRNPLAGAHTIQVAQDKAYTAATFQGETIALTKQLDFMKSRPHIVLFGGGLPIKQGGYMYGAVGVSGAAAQKVPGDVDDICGQAGIDAIKEALEFAE